VVHPGVGAWFNAITLRLYATGAPFEFEERIVDNMCMQLVQKPELYETPAAHIALVTIVTTASPMSRAHTPGCSAE
jgi:isocitrate/isopropylmalate dehydrogenase